MILAKRRHEGRRAACHRCSKELGNSVEAAVRLRRRTAGALIDLKGGELPVAAFDMNDRYREAASSMVASTWSRKQHFGTPQAKDGQHVLAIS